MRLNQRLSAAFEKSALYGFLLRLWGWLPLPRPLRWMILWLGQHKFLVGVGAVVVNERGEVLLFHHTYRPDHPWGLPGGWLKGGEEPVQAVAREIYEESRMAVKVVRPLQVALGPRFPHLDLIFLARYAGGAFRPSREVDQARFFSPGDLPRTYPETRALIQEALKEWKG